MRRLKDGAVPRLVGQTPVKPSSLQLDPLLSIFHFTMFAQSNGYSGCPVNCGSQSRLAADSRCLTWYYRATRVCYFSEGEVVNVGFALPNSPPRVVNRASPYTLRNNLAGAAVLEDAKAIVTRVGLP